MLLLFGTTSNHRLPLLQQPPIRCCGFFSSIVKNGVEMLLRERFSRENQNCNGNPAPGLWLPIKMETLGFAVYVEKLSKKCIPFDNAVQHFSPQLPKDIDICQRSSYCTSTKSDNSVAVSYNRGETSPCTKTHHNEEFWACSEKFLLRRTALDHSTAAFPSRAMQVYRSTDRKYLARSHGCRAQRRPWSRFHCRAYLRLVSRCGSFAILHK